MPAKGQRATEKGAREQTAIRLDSDTIERLEGIAAADAARLGFRPLRSDVLRGCLALGIAAREAELGLAPTSKAGRRRTRR